MSNMTDNRNWSGRRTNAERPPLQWDLPVKAGVEVFAGTIVGVIPGDTVQAIVPWVNDGSVAVRGICQSHVDNTAGQTGDRMARVIAETGKFDNHGSHPCLLSEIYAPIYASDDHTLSINSGDGACVGILTGFDDESGDPVGLIDPFVAAIFGGGTLATGSVSTADLAAGAVTYAKLAGAVHGTDQVISAAGALSLTARTKRITVSSAGVVFTVADGVTGQRMSICLDTVTHAGVDTAVITPTHGGPWTMSVAVDEIEIEFDGTNWLLVNDNRAITNLAPLRPLGGVGHNGAGAATLVGAKVGDKVISVVDATDGSTITSGFEAAITVADQIQQSSATDYSAKKLIGFLVAKS